jgi:hypothetical protein
MLLCQAPRYPNAGLEDKGNDSNHLPHAIGKQYGCTAEAIGCRGVQRQSRHARALPDYARVIFHSELFEK